MSRILRWTGYALTLFGAILIIMAIVGGFRYNHHYCHSHVQTCCNMQPGGNKAVTKNDSASCKQHSMDMSKQDSTKCCKKQVMPCPAGAPMTCNSCQISLQHVGFHLGLAISFLLLAIALFIISNNCCCKKCCEDGKCNCNEEKKE